MAKWSLSDPYCNHCGFWEETIIHVLRDALPSCIKCLAASHKVDRRVGIFMANLRNWIEFNMNHNIG